MLAAGFRRGLLEGSVRLPWKISIVAFMANPLLQREEQVDETIRVLASDPFFDVIELHPMSEQAWRLAEPAIQAGGVEVVFGVQPIIINRGFNPSALDEGERRKAVEMLIESAKLTASRGARALAFCSGPDPGPADRGAAIDSLVRSIKEVAVEAGRLGVKLILETFDRDWDRRRLIGPLSDAVKVAEEVKAEFGNFGLLWDLSHAPMLNESPHDLKRARDHLAHVHIGCAKRLPDGRLVDSHPGFYRPGAINGVEEVAELIRVLLEIGYRGAVGFEVKPEEGQIWREPVEAAKGVLYTALAKVAGEA
ncbi:MAG: sugar phosphate isomerase/epimerase family protein [Thermofilaceae archaeon]